MFLSVSCGRRYSKLFEATPSYELWPRNAHRVGARGALGAVVEVF